MSLLLLRATLYLSNDGSRVALDEDPLRTKLPYNKVDASPSNVKLCSRDRGLVEVEPSNYKQPSIRAVDDKTSSISAPPDITIKVYLDTPRGRGLLGDK